MKKNMKSINTSLPYDLISFDIWNTLLKGNPEFVRARNFLFMNTLSHQDYEYIKTIKDAVDEHFDGLSELTGQDYTFSHRMKDMFMRTNKTCTHLKVKDYEAIRLNLNKIAIQYPPLLIEPDLINTLKHIKSLGIRVACTSNTGFLHGDIMRKILEALGISKYIDLYIFSNEQSVAKPNPELFTTLSEKSGVPTCRILHVGDSVHADYVGAYKSGIQSVLYDPQCKYGHKMYSISNLTQLMEILHGDISVIHYDNISLHQNTTITDDKLVDINKTLFDAISYSRFKYGDGVVAKKYGARLAKDFINKNPHIIDPNFDTQSLVISTSPYKAIAKGSSGIVQGFKTYLNTYLLMHNKPPIIDIVILKDEMFYGDYGTMSVSDRKKIMDNSRLYVMDEFIKNKELIIIDDARITGSHESNLVRFLSPKGIKCVHFLYVVDMQSDVGIQQPDIEAYINHAWMDHHEKLVEIMCTDDFILNARVCKYILSIKSSEALLRVLSPLPKHVLYSIYSGVISDGYASMPIYKKNFSILSQVVNEKRVLPD